VVEKVTIYVDLLDEAVDVWRPVEATVEADGAYQLPPHAPSEERWQFPPGSRVRCETKRLEGRWALVASRLAE
jgi:hypothetical protein